MRLDTCYFCSLPEDRILSDTELTLVIRDGYPVSKGHTLIIPKRHVASIFEATTEEQIDIFSSLDKAKKQLDKTLNPDGYNIGINDGISAGQTVMHLHIHLIPRYTGDQNDPRGGIRWILPEKADYWTSV
ncbi:HIT family protein [Desulfobacula sp.]|uniref:HIT family protein n=1 Tax=Desulfobacula sp. TaxID=2593537 RepID=UPI001EB257EF|nr:HIT family protein [Desulfobacula sp.]